MGEMAAYREPESKQMLDPEMAEMAAYGLLDFFLIEVIKYLKVVYLIIGP